MHFNTALVALAAASLVSAAPGGWGGGGGYGQCKAWETSSTCSAVYKTKTETYSKPEKSVVTKTTYKPVTYTTTSVSTSYSTEYCMCSSPSLR